MVNQIEAVAVINARARYAKDKQALSLCDINALDGKEWSAEELSTIAKIYSNFIKLAEERKFRIMTRFLEDANPDHFQKILDAIIRKA
jgi:hypothetical protein